MSSFKNGFLSFANGSLHPDKWRPYFLAYQPDKWDEEGDGVLVFKSDKNIEYSLIIVHWSKLGFMLQHKCRNLDNNRTLWYKYSIGNRDALTCFDELDGIYYPVGSFMSPSQAWLAVEDFLANPTQPSTRIQWVDDTDILWPNVVF